MRRLNGLSQLFFCHSLNIRTEQNAIGREPDVMANFFRHEIIVTGENFDGDPMFLKNSNGWPGAFLWRIEEGNISFKHQFLFIIL